MTGFREEELEDLLGLVKEPTPAGRTPTRSLGKHRVLLLGEHRVLCGDATKTRRWKTRTI